VEDVLKLVERLVTDVDDATDVDVVDRARRSASKRLAYDPAAVEVPAATGAAEEATPLGGTTAELADG
jgi:hypothetical protein